MRSIGVNLASPLARSTVEFERRTMAIAHLHVSPIFDEMDELFDLFAEAVIVIARDPNVTIELGEAACATMLAFRSVAG